jgi:menaquinone-dependent protoporphyrinogen oxidase
MNSKGALVVYATVHGQAERIARRIAEAAREWSIETAVRDVRDTGAAELAQYETIVLVASVQFGKHSRAAARFVKKNRARLAQMHTAFISVSGDAAEPATRPRAEEYARTFFRTAGWTADETLLAAGAIPFSKYNFVLSFIMKRIAASKGQPLDPHRDYEFTNWEDVMRFAKAFLTSPVTRVA